MVPLYSFTREDNELIKGQSVRDPLGTQVIWSSFGRKIIPHLTEQTNSVLGFQLLISSLYFYEKYSTYLHAEFEKIKGEKITNASHAFSLENVFILLEQAFAFSYFTFNEDWPLFGKRQVSALRDKPRLSVKREKQILSSQLATGIWGYYRGAAIRAGLIDKSGRSVVDSIRELMINDPLNKEIFKRKTLQTIKDALLSDEVNFPNQKNSQMVKAFNSILTTIPQKGILREHLLSPNGNDTVGKLAGFAHQNKLKGKGPKEWRQFIIDCKKKFPEQESDYNNIIRCTDYVGSLEWIFEWLMSFKGESLESISKELKISLVKLEKAKNEFACAAAFLEGAALTRSRLFLSAISFETAPQFLASLIRLHNHIAEIRGAQVWIRSSDSGRLIVETESYVNRDSLPTVSPGSGWRYDYYLTPLMNIYSGLK